MTQEQAGGNAPQNNPQAAQRSEPEPLAVSTHRAAELVGVSERHLRTMVTLGVVRTVRFGKRVLVPVDELRRIVELPETGA